MEIEIKSKKNNPLLDRTEVHFIIKHDGEKTPGRDIIKNDLAEKLNTKKENVLVQTIKTGFGSSETVGYAKVYSSFEKTKGIERNFVLKRNSVSEGTKKADKKKTEKSPKEQESTEAIKEDKEEVAESEKEEATKEKETKEEVKKEEKTDANDKKEESSESVEKKENENNK